jgi:hypothetical protein
LPLSEDARPGDRVFLPAIRWEREPAGIVNRLAELAKQENGVLRHSCSMGTDWAPGSSGAAVIDECGNAIGFVSMVLPFKTIEKPCTRGNIRPTWMVLHEAVGARELKALIRAPDKGDEHG